MNILGFNIQISRNATTRAAATSPPQQKELALTPEEWFRCEGAGGITLSNAYEQVVWVYRAVNVLAEQVANVPFLFSNGERGRENLVTSGPLHEFFNRPHPRLNRFQYWELRVIWLMLRGECFRIPIFDDAPGAARPEGGRARRRLKQVLLLDPAHFQHIVENHELIGWRYRGFGPDTPLAAQVFLPEEVWFERLPNPFDFWRGLPPLYVASLAAQTDFAAAAFMRGIIENNADAGVIVRTDKWLGKEQREQIFAALRERKRRAGCADKPVLITGAAEVIQPQLSSSDLQFLQNRKFSRAEICAAFGVPEEIVTSTDHAKYDVMAGARLNFIENRVAPLCARLEAEEEETVRSIDPRASGWFDLESLPILQEARKQRLAAARAGFEMGVPFNELNRVLDLGFHPLPWGDRGFVAANLQELKAPDAPPKDGRPESKLRRFFFEQRGRALAALEKADLAAAGDSMLIDPAAEAEHLLAMLNPAEPSAAAPIPAAPATLAAAGRTVAALHALLAAGLARGESRETLAARVKRFYNEIAARGIPSPRPEQAGPAESPAPVSVAR